MSNGDLSIGRHFGLIKVSDLILLNSKGEPVGGNTKQPANQDVCNFYGDAQGVYNECGGVVLDAREGKRLAASLGPKGKGLILRNHGLLTVGQTVDEAAYLFTLLEASCEAQLRADAAAANGLEKTIIDDEAAAFTFRMTSDPV